MEESPLQSALWGVARCGREWLHLIHLLSGRGLAWRRLWRGTDIIADWWHQRRPRILWTVCCALLGRGWRRGCFWGVIGGEAGFSLQPLLRHSSATGHNPSRSHFLQVFDDVHSKGTMRKWEVIAGHSWARPKICPVLEQYRGSTKLKTKRLMVFNIIKNKPEPSAWAEQMKWAAVTRFVLWVLTVQNQRRVFGMKLLLWSIPPSAGTKVIGQCVSVGGYWLIWHVSLVWIRLWTQTLESWISGRSISAVQHWGDSQTILNWVSYNTKSCQNPNLYLSIDNKNPESFTVFFKLFTPNSTFWPFLQAKIKIKSGLNFLYRE